MSFSFLAISGAHRRFGYAGNTCVQTPNIDRLASQSINADTRGFGLFGLLSGARVLC